MSLNFHTALFLVNTKARGLLIAYEWCDRDGKDVNGKPVKTDLFKTLDQSIKVGDLVLGETQSRHKLCVYKVVEADVEVDLERDFYIPWVIGKVTSNLPELKANEEEMLSAIRRKDKEKKRAELADTMLKDYGEVVRGLAIASGGPALPAANNVPVPPETPQD